MPKYTKHSQVRLFADDTIVYLTITNKDDCQNLQEDLKRLEVWKKEWLMEFHPAKCHVLGISRKKNTATFPYSLHGQVLTEVKSAKHLGVTISNDMTWNNHIDSTAAKANKKLGFLKRNIKVKDSALKEKTYKAIVRPTVEYCATVWDPHYKTQAATVEKVQRRAARWVTGRFHNMSSVSDMLSDLGWRDLNQRRVNGRLCMAYKIVHGLVAIPIGQFIKVQRDGVHLQTIYAKPNYYLYSFFPRTVSDWNHLPGDTLSANPWQSSKVGLPPCNMKCHTNIYLFGSAFISHSTNSFIFLPFLINTVLSIHLFLSQHRTQPISHIDIWQAVINLKL